MATDHLESDQLRGADASTTSSTSSPGTACTSTSRRQTGVVFHMISCLTEHGRVGLTAVGDTPEEAEATYQRAQRLLLTAARDALEEAPLRI